VATTYTYQDSRGWLTDIDTLAGSTVLQDINYAHDDAGRITATSSSVSGESWSYGYDDMDRLLSADNVNNNALDQNFTYDSVGNLTSNSLIGTYTYPAPGSARPHAVTATPLGSYGYDANGSMTSAAGDTLTYDGENRLASVNSVQFVYGPDGARLKKIAGATTTIYLGADIEIVGSTTIKYLPGDARRAGLSTTTWVSRDNLSSFRIESDNTGAVAWRANYRPYGERLITVSGVSESKGYIGERHDDDTGLLYLNARYYDPVLARFIQADPSDPGQPGVGPNRYAYAGGNPIGAVDPSGLSSEFPWGPQFGCDPCYGIGNLNPASSYAYITGVNFDLGQSFSSPSDLLPSGSLGSGASLGSVGSSFEVDWANIAYESYPSVMATERLNTLGAVAAGIAIADGPEPGPADAVAGAVVVVGSVIIGGQYLADNATHKNSSKSQWPTELYYLINRDSGVIDKIGITSNLGERYSQAYLIAENVRYEPRYCIIPATRLWLTKTFG
jgi:RHS repeat-associated protein